MTASEPVLAFSEDEIAQSQAYYRDTLDKQPRIDFGKAWMVWLVRQLTNVATLDRRALKAHGLKAESRTVAALGRSAPVRIIRKPGPVRAVIVDIHGGGWTLGRAAMDDPINAEFADAGFAVVSVDYRFAPKYPFADVIGDCEAALAWALDHCEAEFGTTDIFLNGESAGAHLALSAAIRRRDAGADLDRLKGMLLFYGCYDLSGTPSVRTTRPDTLLLNGASLPVLFRTVTRRDDDAALKHPSISPLHADLAGLPPALLMAGTADPLIDDSRLLAERLREAGVASELIVVPHAPHSFNRLPTALAKSANTYARAWIGKHLTRT